MSFRSSPEQTLRTLVFGSSSVLGPVEKELLAHSFVFGTAAANWRLKVGTNWRLKVGANWRLKMGANWRL